MNSTGHSFTFPKSERLKSKKYIEELFKKGSSFYSSPLQLKYLKIQPTDVKQVLFAVPKKYHKLAVSRNRIKRLMREVYRHNRHLVGSDDQSGYLLAFMYLSKDIPTLAELEPKLIGLLKRLSDGIQKV